MELSKMNLLEALSALPGNKPGIINVCVSLSVWLCGVWVGGSSSLKMFAGCPHLSPMAWLSLSKSLNCYYGRMGK